jgi:DNA ligase (NAD+)
VSRDQIHAYIEDGGGEVRTSVSSKLQYLIVGSDAGSKLQKAKELGVGILTIDDFVERFGRGW